MKIIFHENQLCYRGTSNAIFDYAHYNEEILNNQSVILYPKNSPNNIPEAIQRFEKRFTVYGYNDLADRDKFIRESNADIFYAIKSGEKENDIPTNLIKTVIHAVFKYNEPYGNVYAYVSEWLSNKMSNGILPFVPHIVDLPNIEGNFREELNIPKDAIVFARYGGYETFDIDFVKEIVKNASGNENFQQHQKLGLLLHIGLAGFINGLRHVQHQLVRRHSLDFDKFIKSEKHTQNTDTHAVKQELRTGRGITPDIVADIQHRNVQVNFGSSRTLNQGRHNQQGHQHNAADFLTCCHILILKKLIQKLIKLAYRPKTRVASAKLNYGQKSNPGI